MGNGENPNVENAIIINHKMSSEPSLELNGRPCNRAVNKHQNSIVINTRQKHFRTQKVASKKLRIILRGD